MPIRRICTILALAIIPLFSARAQPETVRFRHLTTEDGLPVNSVLAVEQDYQGFIWIGTREGLARYDGSFVRTFLPIPGEGANPHGNTITAIHEDVDRTLWVTTLAGGIVRFNRGLESFSQYKHDLSDPNSLSSNIIHSIAEDSSRSLWLGTDRGVSRLDTESGSIIQYPVGTDLREPGESVLSTYVDRQQDVWAGSISGRVYRLQHRGTSFRPVHIEGMPDGAVRKFREDDQRRIWIGMDGGGFGYLQDDSYHAVHVPDAADIILSGDIRSLLSDHDGALWVATYGAGLARIGSDGSIRWFRHLVGDAYGIPNNYVTAVFQDRQDILWVGTDGGGVSIMDPNRRLFPHIEREPGDPRSLSSDNATAILEDRNGALWVGTHGGGLNRRGPDDRGFTHYRHDPDNPNSISSDIVNALEEDNDGRIWIGTEGGGLCRLNPDRDAIQCYRSEESDIGSDKINSLLVARDGRLFVGTTGAGVNALDPETGAVERSSDLFPDAEWVHAADVSALYEDYNGRLWCGFVDGGLLVLSRSTGGFTYFEPQFDDPAAGPAGGAVQTILQDRGGIVWLGTSAGGLSRLDPGAELFKHYTRSNSRIPSSAVHAILEDEEGFLWLSTNSGLSRFDPEAEIFQEYGPSHGVQGIVFGPRAYAVGSDGTMYFGGLGGITVIRQGSFAGSRHLPQVALTELQVFSAPVRPHDDGPIAVAMPVADRIVLQASQNLITIGFAALHFADPSQNKAMVRLTGFDDEWRFLGTVRSATYTNLDPGEYTFQVLVSNSDGVWNRDGTSIAIRVLPHWYASTWARILFLLAALGLVVALVELAMRLQRRRFERQRLATQAELQSKELERERLVNERLREVDAMKTSFLANMGHEIRTPLSLIIGYAEMLEREVQGAAHDLATSIHVGGQRLMVTLNSLLDLAQLEAGSVRTNLQPLDLVTQVSQIISLFKAQADERGIELEWDEDQAEDIQIVADEVGLQRVLVNLVGNAIKFTQHGSVSLHLTAEDQWGVITITDTGIGMGEDFLPHVFSEYRQESTGFGRLFPGSGLGLAISKRMVELMKGEISVMSSKGEGSTFTVRLPLLDGISAGEEEASDLSDPEQVAPDQQSGEPAPDSATHESQTSPLRE